MAKNILVYEVKHYKEVLAENALDDTEVELVPITEQEYGNGGFGKFEVLEGLKNATPVQM